MGPGERASKEQLESAEDEAEDEEALEEAPDDEIEAP